jgi:hypothetical protein
MRRTDQNLPSYQIAALASYLVGAGEKAVHTEDIALKAFELAPNRFSWKKYPNNIDLEAVRVALRHGTEPQHGSLLSGSMETGWMLTPEGLQWATQAEETITGGVTSKARRGSHQAALDAEVDRILSTSAWEKARLGRQDDISVYEFQSLARVNEYTSASKYSQRIGQIKLAGSERPEILDLIEFLDSKFGVVFKK